MITGADASGLAGAENLTESTPQDVGQQFNDDRTLTTLLPQVEPIIELDTTLSQLRADLRTIFFHFHSTYTCQKHAKDRQALQRLEKLTPTQTYQHAQINSLISPSPRSPWVHTNSMENSKSGSNNQESIPRELPTLCQNFGRSSPQLVLSTGGYLHRQIDPTTTILMYHYTMVIENGALYTTYGRCLRRMRSRSAHSSEGSRQYSPTRTAPMFPNLSANQRNLFAPVHRWTRSDLPTKSKEHFLGQLN